MRGPTQIAVIASVALALSFAPALQNAPEAANDSTQLCPDIQFSAYSTVEPAGRRVTESIVWDSQQRTYFIRGPQLARLLNYPGAAQIPNPAPDAAVFNIAIDKPSSGPAKRVCEEQFRDSAVCTITGTQEALANYSDIHREVVYTQNYTDCDLQTYDHVIRISEDRAGKLVLLVLTFEDLTGQSKTLLFGAGTDLSRGGSQAIIPRR